MGFKKIFIFLLFFVTGLESATILLDPGHGGEDLGARAKMKGPDGKPLEIYEKDLTLEITNILYEKLKTQYNVFRTRSLDRTVELMERANIAEKVKADLFISIHLNSSTTYLSSGFETYYLDNHNNKAVKKVEDVENKVLTKNEDTAVQHILADLVVRSTVKSSIPLAQLVHKELRKVLPSKFKMKDRGVRPGLFFVLVLGKRPGILLEVGFMSNSKELSLMRRRDFQERYAEAVAQGIRKFLAENQKSKVSFF